MLSDKRAAGEERGQSVKEWKECLYSVFDNVFVQSSTAMWNILPKNKYIFCLGFFSLLHVVFQVCDQLSVNKPSEMQVSSEEVQNPCRLVLRPPKLREPPVSKSVYSKVNETKTLFLLAIALLLSSIFTF